MDWAPWFRSIASIQVYAKKSFVHLFSASITIFKNSCVSKDTFSVSMEEFSVNIPVNFYLHNNYHKFCFQLLVKWASSSPLVH